MAFKMFLRPRPMRSLLYKTGPLEVNFINNATVISIGENNKISKSRYSYIKATFKKEMESFCFQRDCSSSSNCVRFG